MAVTVNGATFSTKLGATVLSGTGADFSFSEAFSHTLKDSSGNFLFDRVFALLDYSLTVAAGNLNVDLYDLGTLNVGAGAGQDNLGLAHANARIVAICIRNQVATSGGTLRIDQAGVGGAAWEGLFHGSTSLDLAQGAFIQAYLGESGKTVTDSTDHILRFAAQSATCTMDLIFFSKQT